MEKPYLLLRYYKSLSKDSIQDIVENSMYDKVILLCNSQDEELQGVQHRSGHGSIEMHVVDDSQMEERVQHFLEKYAGRYHIIPYFQGEKFSFCNIKVYEYQYGKQLNPEIFREKDVMNEYLSDVIQKVSRRYTYQELQDLTHEKLRAEIGGAYILKPTNASRSIYTRVIPSQESLEEYQQEVSPEYEYIAEEYYTGDLYSVDLFCDGEKAYALVVVREICPEEIPSIRDQVKEHHRQNIALTHTVPIEHLSAEERDFVAKVTSPLMRDQYRGFIHLEYKYDPDTGKVGFIEWGARSGAYRRRMFHKIYHYWTEHLPLNLMHKKLSSRFEQAQEHVWFLRMPEEGRQIMSIKTLFEEEVRLQDFLNDLPQSYLEVPLSKMLEKYVLQKWGIEHEIFYIKATTKNQKFLPSHSDNTTRLHTLGLMDATNYHRYLEIYPEMILPLAFQHYRLSQAAEE